MTYWLPVHSALRPLAAAQLPLYTAAACPPPPAAPAGARPVIPLGLPAAPCWLRLA